MAVTGRSPKHLRTDSEDNGLDVSALLEKAADCFSACMDAKIDSMMEHWEKRVDDKVDSKLGPAMDRLTPLEKTSISSTRSGSSSSCHNGGSAGGSTGPATCAPPYREIKEQRVFRDRNTHGLTEAQAREFITKLRQGIGSDLVSFMARVGAMRVRNTKTMCYLKHPSLSNCKHIREAMCFFFFSKKKRASSCEVRLFS